MLIVPASPIRLDHRPLSRDPEERRPPMGCDVEQLDLIRSYERSCFSGLVMTASKPGGVAKTGQAFGFFQLAMRPILIRPWLWPGISKITSGRPSHSSKELDEVKTSLSQCGHSSVGQSRRVDHAQDDESFAAADWPQLIGNDVGQAGDGLLIGARYATWPAGCDFPRASPVSRSRSATRRAAAGLSWAINASCPRISSSASRPT
jgi:hypothetical protein